MHKYFNIQIKDKLTMIWTHDLSEIIKSIIKSVGIAPMEKIRDNRLT